MSLIYSGKVTHLYHALFALLSFFLVSPAYSENIDGVEIIPVPGSDQRQGIIRHTLKGNIEEVWNILMDVERYPQTMPRNEGTKLISKNEQNIRYSARINMPWPISDVAYDCDLFPDPKEKKITFKMVPGSGQGVRDFYGSWELKKVSNTETFAVYSLVFEPIKKYPRWATSLGLKSTLGNVMSKIQEDLDSKKNAKP